MVKKKLEIEVLAPELLSKADWLRISQSLAMLIDEDDLYIDDKNG